MKAIKFLQHYKLEHPFDDWKNQTYEEAVKLSRGEISPHVHPDIQKFLQENFTETDFIKTQVILSSPIQRAVETAKAIQQEFLPNVKITECQDIGEVTWDLGSFLSKQDFEEAKNIGHYDIGNKRIEAFINNSAPTTLNETWERVENFEKLVKALPYDNILVITHSFLMKVLYAYFVRGIRNKSQVDVPALKQTYEAGYLRGFETTI